MTQRVVRGRGKEEIQKIMDIGFDCTVRAGNLGEEILDSGKYALRGWEVRHKLQNVDYAQWTDQKKKASLGIGTSLPGDQSCAKNRKSDQAIPENSNVVVSKKTCKKSAEKKMVSQPQSGGYDDVGVMRDSLRIQRDKEKKKRLAAKDAKNLKLQKKTESLAKGQSGLSSPENLPSEGQLVPKDSEN